MARSFRAGWLFLVPLALLARKRRRPFPDVAVDGVPAIPMKLLPSNEVSR